MNAKTEIKLPVKAHLTIIEDADGLSIIDTSDTGFSHEQCCAHATQAAHAINCHARLVEALESARNCCDCGQTLDDPIYHAENCPRSLVREALELAKGGA